MSNILKNIGGNIRSRREDLGFTQEDIAGMAEMDRSFICDLENGKRDVRVSNLQRLAVALRCSLKDLV